jgi:4-amino-4-deoxy-L-arabinose transferase-like glycosyltransferase
MWWDEAVYLGLGRNIEKGFYSLDREELVDTFRPPLFSLMISPFSNSILFSRILVIIFSVLSIAMTYYLSKELFGKDVALLSSLFLSTNQFFVFFSTKILSESLFIFFISLSLLFFLRRRKPVNAFASGLFAGLALMTRYLGTIIVASYAFYSIYIFYRKREMKLFNEVIFISLGFAISIFPWLALSQVYYGSIWGAYFTNLSVYSGSIASDFSSYFADIYSVFGLQLIFIIVGIYVMLRQEKTGYKFLLVSLLILPLLFFSFAFHRESRYVLSYMPVYAIFCGLALRFESKNFGKYLKYLPLAAVLVCVISLFTGLSYAWNDRVSGESLVEGSLYLKNITQESDIVMTESRPYIYYFSERRAVRFPDSPEDVSRVIEYYKVKFIFVYKFEPGNPPYVADYFGKNSGFGLVKKYEQWGDPEAVRIYEVIR